MTASLSRQSLCSPDMFNLFKGLICFYLSKYLAIYTLLRRKKKELEAAKCFNESVRAGNIYSICTQLWEIAWIYINFWSIFSIDVNNPLNLTYSSSFNMTHDSLSPLLLKPAAWKDFDTITVPDFSGQVLCLFHGAVCQWRTWADTDDSLRFTHAPRSSSSNQTKITPNCKNLPGIAVERSGFPDCGGAQRRQDCSV